MQANTVGSVVETASTSPSLWAAIIATTSASLAAMIYFWITVRKLECAMGAPNLKEYTFATSFYPDALIIKFGAEERFRTLSSQIKFTNVVWARILWHLEKSLVNVIYANRRTAGNAIARNPHIIASARPLCIYRGFAICLKPSALGTAGGQELSVERFSDILKNAADAMILVHEETDQHRALRRLLTIIGQQAGLKGKRLEKRVAGHIHAISPDSDLLERMWAFDPVIGAGNPDPLGNGGNIIGLAGGLTERVIAKRLGYGIVAPDDTDAENYSEINSFVYCAPPNQSDGDLSRMLDEVEQLWDDTVTRILNQPATQACFREFINTNIRTQLGPATLARLSDQPVFSEADVVDFLSNWVSFPRHGKPAVVWVAPSP